MFITTLPLTVAAFTNRRAIASAFVIGLFVISAAAGGILDGRGDAPVLVALRHGQRQPVHLRAIEVEVWH